MIIERDKNLKDLNTFMVPVVARYFSVANDGDSLIDILSSDEWKQSENKMILGEGSNILFIEDYNGFILKNDTKGISIIDEDDDSVTVRVGAGENWHDFVMWSVKNNYWGIENLAYIPGSVGASPVQNIGAYGAEVSSIIDSVECISLSDLKPEILSNSECNFSYRDSIFKKNPEKYLISYVNFKLQKNGIAKLNYGQVQEFLDKKNIQKPTLSDIAEIIIEIRKSKLPNVGEIGMAGSFFKNPVISTEHAEKIRIDFPDIKYFDMDNGEKKIPAGWLLEELGYKGFQTGNVGNYLEHALIVTHSGGGTGAEVWEHVQNIMQKTKDVFGIDLEPEVKIIGRKNKV